MVWTQPSIGKRHVYQHNHVTSLRNLDFYDLSPGSYAPTRPDESRNSKMWIDVLTSNILENRLITSQLCESLTSATETTNNDNGHQGTISTIHRMWIEELKLNIREITQSKANDVNLSSSVKKFPLGHASSKVPEGSLSINFPDNELKLTGSDSIEGGP